ncbi:MlaD family protein [Flavisolibacter nicotianae]|uniref:MlaD family protein n=1 Tax=Flavisolibacter nicotianae TaxID=2364882 RepID=UPI000EAC0C3F|nr:MlaD family protein [Flavisolibacter nicotianae]
MEKKNKRAVIVGAFVFAALVIFVLGVMTLGGQKSLFNKGATIHTIFNEVSGLQPGNNVWFAGVKVGTVQNLSFNKEGKVDVEMNIGEKSLSMIRKDSKAKIGAESFIGNKIIVIYGGSAAAPVVETGSTLQSEQSLSTEEMMATFQENNKNLLAITENFKTISGRLLSGQGSAGKLLNDDGLYRDLQASMASLKIAVANAQNLVANASDYTTRLTAKGSLANDLVTDTVVFARLRSTVRQIDALSQRADQVMANLNTASSNVNQSLADPSSPAGLLLNDKQTAAEIRTTIKNLQSSTQKLDENMEALQHNFLLRGFFRKKAKSQEEVH